MKRASTTMLVCAMGILLAGCSMRDYLEKETPAQTMNTRQDLSMPPDLRLPPPGTTAAAPDPGAAAAAASASKQASLAVPPADAPVYNPPKATTAPAKSAATASSAATTAAATQTASADNSVDAIYTNAGINVNNPDGTRKTNQQLNQELQAYYIAQKKAKNPNYGSVFNIGNIFKDE